MQVVAERARAGFAGGLTGVRHTGLAPPKRGQANRTAAPPAGNLYDKLRILPVIF